MRLANPPIRVARPAVSVTSQRRRLRLRIALWERTRSALTLSLFFLVTPVSLAKAVAATLLGRVAPGGNTSAEPLRGTRNGRTVLVSGGKMSKALHLARHFSRGGYRVVVAETSKYRCCGTRFSRAVDRFRTLPDFDNETRYVAALCNLVVEEKIDFYVPACSPAASRFDAAAAASLSEHCRVVHVGADRIDTVDNKFRFAAAAREIGLGAPKSFLVTTPADVLDHDFSGERRKYILKRIAYDAMRRLDLRRLPIESEAAFRGFVESLPMGPDDPWVLQEFVPGEEFCAHVTAHDGRVTIFCCCRSSAFQLDYESIDDPEIEDWVTRFVSHYELTGQLSFDFIRAVDDGKLYAIECNPRVHSAITTFHATDGVADAYVGVSDEPAALKPREDGRPTYWLFHEAAEALACCRSFADLKRRWLKVIRGTDAVLSWRDPLPFIALHHLQIPSLLIRDIFEGKGWKRIDFNIGKLVQRDGD